MEGKKDGGRRTGGYLYIYPAHTATPVTAQATREQTHVNVTTNTFPLLLP